jgi:D-alanyl-D-alanine carboxypeptidase
LRVVIRALLAALVVTLLPAATADAPPRVDARAWPRFAVGAPGSPFASVAARPRPAKARRPAAVVARPAEPPLLVAPGGIEDAQRWARRRAGTVAFAVAREGRSIRGIAIHRRYYSASVVKAMLALAVLRAAGDRGLTAGERALLRPMIVASDNDAATAVYASVGASALYAIARAARMKNFDVGFNWADAQLTARDQARLFMHIDRLTPRRHRAYFRGLLGSIVSYQRWGIAPIAAARGFHVMFKGGWRIGIFHQVALLERDGKRVALAILTRSADHGYGRETQAGIAARVLARLPRRQP